MAFEYPGAGALDYVPCRYAGSKVLFRGPARDPQRADVAVLGGTETYGKFVADPFAAQVERNTGLRVVNLGCVNAGPDVLLAEPAILEVAASARMAVVQVVGARNLSNAYYRVHPRRNDRLVAILPPLRALYPEVDFAEFNFTRHLLRVLHDLSAERFDIVARALRDAWVARMTEILARLRPKALLLWMADRPVPDHGARPSLEDPFLVDRAMLRAVSARTAGLVEVIVPRSSYGPAGGGMVYGPMDIPALATIPGAPAHGAVAAALSAALADLL